MRTTPSALAGAPPRRRARRRSAAIAVLALALVAAAVAFGAYRRQVVSYLTHTKGSPTSTEPYVTLVPPPALHLAVAGDVGDSGRRLDATGAAIGRVGASAPFDALLLLGDNVYPNGDPAKLPAVLAALAPVLDRGADLLAILGNHDVLDGNGPAQLEALGMPDRYWAKRYGDVLIVGLDSNTGADAAQRAWLDATLSASDARWTIVALHHPPYSAGYQGSNTTVREAYAPLFARHGVQLVLSGHDHDYQRSKAIDGVTYVVSGGAAGTRRTGEASFTAVSFSWHHFVDVAVFDDRLVLRAVNQDGRVADELTLTNPGTR